MTSEQKKKVTLAADDSEESQSQFKHAHTKTAHALEHAKMVQKGKKFWEQKEQYEPLSDMEWWQLKAAKDFETGIGQKFYRHGTLSTWTEQQIATLHSDMKMTLKMAGYQDDEEADRVQLDDPETTILPSQKVDAADMNDFAAEIKRQRKEREEQIKSQHSKPPDPIKDGDEEQKDPLFEFDDEIIHSGHSDNEDEDGKRSEYDGSSMSGFDASKFKQLTSVDDLAGKFDAEQMGSHRRTRTEALRFKLQNMEKQLQQVTMQKADDAKMRNQELQTKLSGMKGALSSANDELDRAEEQIAEKDEEIANLKRELALSKQMNTELAQRTLDLNTGGKREGKGGGGNEDEEENEDDGGKGDKDKDIGMQLLEQRMKDANRFAFMLSAMQEQLEFERKQFVAKIHRMELELEHKDVQLNALYQLYNKLVQTTQKKSWWERLTHTGMDE